MTSRDRRAIGIGVTVVVAGWLLTAVVPKAVRYVRAIEDDLDERILLLEREQREISGVKMLSDSIATYEKLAGSLQRVLLMGNEQTTAGFDLTRRLSDALSRTAAFVQAVTPLPDSARVGRLRRTQVRANLETDVVGLMEILKRVEADSSMKVESVTVTSPPLRRSPDDIERLNVLVNVSGWFIGDSARGDSVPVAGRN